MRNSSSSFFNLSSLISIQVVFAFIPSNFVYYIRKLLRNEFLHRICAADDWVHVSRRRRAACTGVHGLFGRRHFSAPVPQREPPNQPDAHPSGCAPRCGGGRPSGGGEPMRGTPPLSLGAAAACPPPRRQGAWGASHALFFRRWSPTQASQTPLPGAGPRPKRRTHPPSRRLGAWGGVSFFRMPSM